MNKNNHPTIYFIDKLIASSWVLDIFPYFFKNGWGRIKNRTVYYIDGSRIGILLARLTLGAVHAKLKKFDFCMRDVKNSHGDSIWLKVMFEDALEFQSNILNNPDFKSAVNTYDRGGGLPLFLFKEIMCNYRLDPDVLLKYLYLIRVISWKMRSKEKLSESLIFLMQRKPWSLELRKFALREKIDIVCLARKSFSVRRVIERSNGLKLLFKKIIYCWMLVKHKRRGGIRSKNLFESLETDSPKMAVEHYGKLNLDSPELFSDLFFYQMSNFSAEHILIYFGLPSCPVTEEQLHEIKKHGMSAVAINSRAATTPNILVFHSSRRKIKIDWPKDTTDKDVLYNRGWLSEKILNYHMRYNHWVDFFTRYNIKIHVSWYKQSSNHCTIADAMQSVGGVSVIYQRSFESLPVPWTTTKSDVVFGFSKLGAHIGKDTHSIIPYYIVTGYLGDHRFAFSCKRAQEVRGLLKSHGAKKIIAYIDENPSKDSRWGMGKEIPHKDQARLFNMVLEKPWFGLILKPKFPSSFREGLGPIAELLRRAEETGRCFVFEDGVLGSNYPPAVASLSADIVIHGYLSATTAAVEAALAGIPALMLDYEGWSQSILYKLGEGKVVFRSLDDSLKACQEHWNTPNGIPGLGDWSHMLDEFDPFRDGRAAERMGTYLQWIQEGFKAKLSKETVLADAAQRYAKIWGKDKILSVNHKGANYQLV